jgi:hypothetical protein
VLAPQRQVDQLEGYHSAASLRLPADQLLKLDRGACVAIGGDFFQREPDAGEVRDSACGVAHIGCGYAVGEARECDMRDPEFLSSELRFARRRSLGPSRADDACDSGKGHMLRELQHESLE